MKERAFLRRPSARPDFKITGACPGLFQLRKAAPETGIIKTPNLQKLFDPF
jgi:hypothetical protein